PCLNPDKIVSMSLINNPQGGPWTEIQEGTGNATVRITAPPGTNVRLRFRGSASPGDFDNWQNLFSLLDGRWLMDVPIPAVGYADVSLVAANDGLPEGVEYVVVRFDTADTLAGSLDRTRLYWPWLTPPENESYVTIRIRDVSAPGGAQPDPPID